MSVNKKEKKKPSLCSDFREKPRNIWDVLGFTRHCLHHSPRENAGISCMPLKKTAEIIQHNPLSHDACKRMPLWML